jgi:hypothetical protein
MFAKDFKERTHLIAEHQEEYETLPAMLNQQEGSITFCWFNKEEIDRINKTGEIWMKQFTFGNPMNPIALSTIKEELIHGA